MDLRRKYALTYCSIKFGAISADLHRIARIAGMRVTKLFAKSYRCNRLSYLSLKKKQIKNDTNPVAAIFISE